MHTQQARPQAPGFSPQQTGGAGLGFSLPDPASVAERHLELQGLSQRRLASGAGHRKLSGLANDRIDFRPP